MSTFWTEAKIMETSGAIRISKILEKVNGRQEVFMSASVSRSQTAHSLTICWSLILAILQRSDVPRWPKATSQTRSRLNFGPLILNRKKHTHFTNATDFPTFPIGFTFDVARWANILPCFADKSHCRVSFPHLDGLFLHQSALRTSKSVLHQGRFYDRWTMASRRWYRHPGFALQAMCPYVTVLLVHSDTLTALTSLCVALAVTCLISSLLVDSTVDQVRQKLTEGDYNGIVTVKSVGERAYNMSLTVEFRDRQKLHLHVFERDADIKYMLFLTAGLY